MAHNSKDKPHKHISNILTEAENISNVNLSFSYKARQTPCLQSSNWTVQYYWTESLRPNKTLHTDVSNNFIQTSANLAESKMAISEQLDNIWHSIQQNII